MKNLTIAAALAAATTAIALPASAAELVHNGGFEDPAGFDAGWSYSVSSTLGIQISPTVGHSGLAAAMFTASYEVYSDVLYQTLDTVAGQTYNVSYWLAGQTTAPAPTHFRVTFGSQIVDNLIDSANFGYTNLGGSFVATADSTILKFEGFNTLGLYLLDDVSVTGPTAAIPEGPGRGVPEPATWAMMLLGFGVLGATLRQRRATPGLAAR